MAHTPSESSTAFSASHSREDPPAPPPKTSTGSTPAQGPPLPPPPAAEHNPNGLHELEGNGQTYRGHAYQRPAAPSIPQIAPNWLPETLRDKTTADLHALLADEALQAALLDSALTTHAAIPASHAALKPLIESNVALASSLLELEDRLQQQRSQTQSRLLALRALEQQHRSKLIETEKAVQSFSPIALYKRLTASVQEQNALVQGLEESWLEEGGVASDREVTEFVKRVKEGKKIAFLRKERKERWDEGRVGGWR